MRWWTRPSSPARRCAPTSSSTSATATPPCCGRAKSASRSTKPAASSENPQESRMRTFKALLFAGLLGAAALVQAAPATYTLDPHHTMVLFSWSHFGFSHPTAELGLGQGTLVFDPDHPEQASVQVTLPMSGLDTHVPALDEHLAKPDFFDAAK